MSKENNGNDTEAPTSGVTKTAAEMAVTNDEKVDFVNLLHQYFLTTGKVMDLKTAVKDYYFTEEEFLKLREDSTVKSMLREREVIERTRIVKVEVDDSFEYTEEEIQDWKLKGLTPVQLIVANAMMDIVDTRSEKKRLQDLGISTSTWDNWLQDPVFSAYLRDRAENLLKNSQHLVHIALLDKVRAGDLKAVQYYNEMMGRYASPTNGGTAAVQVNNNFGFDPRQLVTKLVEIIIDEVEDPRVAQRIADRMRGLIGMTSGTTQLIDPEEPIEVPEIVENRSIAS